MTTSNKPFDAVQMMRSIRDQLDKRIKGMTFEQEQAFIYEQLHDNSGENIPGDGTKETGQPEAP